MYPDESQEVWRIYPQAEQGPCPTGEPMPCSCGVAGKPPCPSPGTNIAAVAIAASSVAIFLILLDHLGKQR